MHLLNRFLFYLRARNRHGTHSPFIYAFLDQTLYAKVHSGDAEERLLLAAVEHFKPKSLGYLEPQSPSGSRPGKDLAGGKSQPPYDLGIGRVPGPELLSWIENKALWHSGSLIYVGGVRKNRKTYEYWKQACRAQGIRLSLETYHAGLLFFRPEQASEHFKIRL